MWKKFVSLYVICSVVLAMFVPAHAAATTIDPDRVYAANMPELASFTEEEITEMSTKEIRDLFEEIFSMDSRTLSDQYMRSCIRNLAAFYRYRASNAPTASVTSLDRASTNLTSYTGEIGVYYERDYDESPLTLNEVSSNLWEVGVGYLTFEHAIILASRLDDTLWSLIQGYVAGEVTRIVLEQAIGAAFSLYGFTLSVSWTASAVGFAIAALDTLVVQADYRALRDATLEGTKSDLTRVKYEWAGNLPYMKTYESVSVRTSYNSTSELYTYYSIPRSTNYSGTWLIDEIGDF